jgi:hypothetical protein
MSDIVGEQGEKTRTGTGSRFWSVNLQDVLKNPLVRAGIVVNIPFRGRFFPAKGGESW